MTSHGFGGCRVCSGKIRAGQVAEIARQISEMKAIIRAHVVQDETQRYDIIFEFDHLVNYDMKPKDLLNELKKIQVDDHGIGHPADFWIIQSTYEHGRLVKEQPHKKPQKE